MLDRNRGLKLDFSSSARSTASRAMYDEESGDRHGYKGYGRARNRGRCEQGEYQKISREHSDDGEKKRRDADVDGCGASAKGPGQFCSGGTAIDEAAEECAEVDAASAIRFEQDVVDETDDRDGEHDHPGFARVQQIPAVDEAVGKNRVDDEGDEAEQHGAANLFELESASKTAKLRFPGEKSGEHDRGAAGGGGVAFTG